MIDRFYFESVYFREPGGILYELATFDGAGYTVDEPAETLGEALSLPPQYEPLREQAATGPHASARRAPVASGAARRQAASRDSPGQTKTASWLTDSRSRHRRTIAVTPTTTINPRRAAGGSRRP